MRNTVYYCFKNLYKNVYKQGISELIRLDRNYAQKQKKVRFLVIKTSRSTLLTSHIRFSLSKEVYKSHTIIITI